jgi:hypothetical protein
MRFTLKTLALLWLVALLARPAAAASFTASLDRDTLTLGESAVLSLTFEGGQARNVPVPSVPGLQFTQNGTSQSMSIVNGAMSSTITVNFSVTPQRVGEFTIPALTADLGGQPLSTAPLTLVVSRAAAPSAAAVNSGSEVAFMRFGFPKNKVYVGQSVVAQLELCLRDDVQNFGNFQLTPLNVDGFSAGKITEGQRRRAQIGNRVYTVIPLLVPLTTVKSGALTLGPFSASAVIVLPGQDQNANPFYRMLNQGEQRQVALATEAVNVESLPLPEQNKPANFTGAVGSFTLSATAGPATVTVGDPITVRVQISGRGSLDAITLPVQGAWQNFKTYPPTAKVEPADQFGFQGTKTFEQIISPLNSDVHEIPPLTFAFFNPDDGRYHTLTQAAVPLVVKAAGATPMPTMALNTSSAPENQPPQDILPLRQNLGYLTPAGGPLIARPAFLVMQSLPVLAFLAAFVWRKRADNLANNPRLRRQRAVAQLISTGLSDLKKFAAENKPEEFFALLFRLLQEQLGERLDCPAIAITESVVGERLTKIGVRSATLESLHELFQLCNQARYAPVRGSAELNSVAAKFEKTIAELQEVKA